MPRYVVERTFRDSWDIGADGEERVPPDHRCERRRRHLAALLRERRRQEVVLHVRGAEPGGDPKEPARNNLPIDSITSVRVLDPYPYRAASPC
jgi:hypothetical protein